MITLALDLNLIPMGTMPRLNVSQYDHGQDVECGLYEGAIPYSIPNGTTAVVQGTKADNTGFEYPCTISNNEVMFKIADQMTVFAGDVTCEVVLLNGEDRIGTINFLLRVEPTALKDDITISETDIPLLQQIPEALLEAQTAAEDAQEWAEKSQEYAVGALHWKGNVAFANLPTSDLTAGDVYSVTDDFTTDSRFNEGAGIPCEAGTNIIWGTNGKWDLQARNAVYSFNGRKGAVVPASGDYTDAQVTSSAITGKATVKAALQGLNADVTQAKADIVQINTDLSNITVIYDQKALEVTVPANSGLWIETDVHKVGKTAVGVVGMRLATFGNMYIQDYYVYRNSSTNRDMVRAYICNPSVSAQHPTAFNSYILYMS